MTKTNLILLGIFALFCNSYNSYAYNPPDSLGLRITKFEVSGSYDLGDTVVIVSEYETDLPVKIEAGLDFSEFLTPVGFTGTTYNTSSTITIDTATTYTDTTYMVVQDEGVTHLSYEINTAGLPHVQDIPNFDDMSSRGVSIITGNNGRLVASTDDNIDDKLYSNYETIGNLGSSGIHSFNYSGKLTYDDWWAPKENYDDPSPERGVPNAVIRMWFINNNDWYTLQELRHPVPLQNDEYIEGVHYCITDDEGNFHFAFDNIPGFTNDDWKVVFAVEKKSEYLDLHSFTDHFEVDMVDTEKRRFFWQLYNDRQIDIDKTCSTHVNNNLEIRLRSYDGQVFRSITFSGMFIKNRLGLDINASFDALPFSEKPGAVYIDVRKYNVSNTSYYYQASNSIKINNRFTLGLLAHEYGHYIHDLMSESKGLSVLSSPNPYREGFAEFYQFAVTNWVNGYFGDEVVSIWRNTEIGPFIYGYGATDYPVGERFFGIYPGGNFSQKGVACFLWNIYDSYTEADFMADEYQGKENDDISGFGRTLFDEIVNTPLLNTSLLNNMKDAYDPSGLNSHLRTSIQKVWDCMMAGDVTNPPKMRSAQVSPQTNGEMGELPGSYIYNIVRQNHGTGSLLDDGYIDYDSFWAVITGCYLNLPSGYNVYTRETELENWTLYDYYAYDIDNEYSIFCFDDEDCPGNGTMQVKLTAYDGNAGESYGAPWFWSTEPDDMSSIDNPSSSDILFEITPNPVTSISNINILTKEKQYLSICIYDYQSRLINEITQGNFGPGPHSFTFNKSGLSSGIYYVVVKTIDSKGNNNIMTKQIVII